MTTAQDPKPEPRPLSARLLPWVEALYKLVLATSALIAIWKALH
ncbi:hypothetical protein [Siccirubricoccus phaeus]|nr:hypothetical protein [Siccirubricoccus phaeus]